MELICDFYSTNVRLMTDKIELETFLVNLAHKCEMHVIGKPVIVGYPWPSSKDWNALSGVCFVGESHITIATYPEKYFVFMNVFSCNGFDRDSVVAFIIRKFQATNPVILELERGLDNKGTIIPARLRSIK